MYLQIHITSQTSTVIKHLKSAGIIKICIFTSTCISLLVAVVCINSTHIPCMATSFVILIANLIHYVTFNIVSDHFTWYTIYIVLWLFKQREYDTRFPCIINLMLSWLCPKYVSTLQIGSLVMLLSRETYLHNYSTCTMLTDISAVAWMYNMIFKNNGME